MIYLHVHTRIKVDIIARETSGDDIQNKTLKLGRCRLQWLREYEAIWMITLYVDEHNDASFLVVTSFGNV